VRLALGALLLFIIGALIDGPLLTLCWTLALLALASELLRRLKGGAAVDTTGVRSTRAGRRGPISIDDLMIFEELDQINLDPLVRDDLAAAARALGRERGLDPVAAAAAIVAAIEGEPEDLAMLGWELPPGLGRYDLIELLRARS